VSVDLSAQLADWDGVSDSLAEIRAGHEDFDRFFREVFEQFDAILSQFAHERDRWQQQRREIEADLGRRAAELERQRAELQVERERVLAESRQTDGHAAVAQEKENQLRERLEEAERERLALHEALEAARAQASQLAPLGAQVAGARDALTQAKRDLDEQRAKQEAARAQTATAGPDEKTLARLRAVEEERDAAGRERLALETELESLRCRAAELAEALEEQKRQAGQQQTQWVAELRQQRALLTVLASRLTEQKLAAVQAPAGGRGAARLEGEGEPDPALASVMAQFEILQQDVARRRSSLSESP
jgi:chromosome segregation ATPase